MRLAREASHLNRNLFKTVPARRPHRKFVCVGMTVLHYPASDTDVKPTIAIVEAVGDMALDLLVFAEGSESWKIISGVRHVDEEKSEAIRLESGGWDFTDHDMRLYNARPELGMWWEDTKEGKEAIAAEEAKTAESKKKQPQPA